MSPFCSLEYNSGPCSSGKFVYYPSICTTLCYNEAYLINSLKAELNPIRHLLALVGDRHIVHVSRIRVKYDTIS
jgi:hypothetical protein